MSGCAVATSKTNRSQGFLFLPDKSIVILLKVWDIFDKVKATLRVEEFGNMSIANRRDLNI